MPDYPLHLDVDLTLSYQDAHQVTISSPQPDRLRLQFEDRAAFRAFLRSTGQGAAALSQLENRLQQLVDTTGIGVEAYVENKRVIDYTANEDAKNRHVFLAVQYLRSLFD